MYVYDKVYCHMYTYKFCPYREIRTLIYLKCCYEQIFSHVYPTNNNNTEIITKTFYLYGHKLRLGVFLQCFIFVCLLWFCAKTVKFLAIYNIFCFCFYILFSFMSIIFVTSDLCCNILSA